MVEELAHHHRAEGVAVAEGGDVGGRLGWGEARGDRPVERGIEGLRQVLVSSARERRAEAVNDHLVLEEDAVVRSADELGPVDVDDGVGEPADHERPCPLAEGAHHVWRDHVDADDHDEIEAPLLGPGEEALIGEVAYLPARRPERGVEERVDAVEPLRERREASLVVEHGDFMHGPERPRDRAGRGVLPRRAEDQDLQRFTSSAWRRPFTMASIL
jgi:hypothetical protein